VHVLTFHDLIGFQEYFELGLALLMWCRPALLHPALTPVMPR